MEWHVMFEAHRAGTTIYVAGHLAERASAGAEAGIAGLHSGTRVVRLDLWAVDVIDPHAFVTVIRALNCWRDRVGGRLYVAFPERAIRPHPSSLRLVTSDAAVASTFRPPITIFEKPTAERAAW